MQEQKVVTKEDTHGNIVANHNVNDKQLKFKELV